MPSTVEVNEPEHQELQIVTNEDITSFEGPSTEEDSCSDGNLSMNEEEAQPTFKHATPSDLPFGSYDWWYYFAERFYFYELPLVIKQLFEDEEELVIAVITRKLSGESDHEEEAQPTFGPATMDAFAMGTYNWCWCYAERAFFQMAPYIRALFKNEQELVLAIMARRLQRQWGPYIETDRYDLDDERLDEEPAHVPTSVVESLPNTPEPENE